jgi:preprotein translocase subunit YajC
MFYSVILQIAGVQQYLPTLLLWGGIFLVFWLFMIRPQQQKQKDQKKFLEGLKKGDKVVTIGGAHGVIVSVGEQTVTVEVDASKGARIVFEKSSISKDASSRLAEKA